MPPTPLLFLNRTDIWDLLPMGECIEVMAEAFRALAEGAAHQPLRTAHRLPDRSGLLGLMPGWMAVPGSDSVFGVKVLSVFPANFEHGEPSHQGVVLLFEGERGHPLAFLDAEAVTAIRTAAVSGLATRLLAREGADDLAILGTGVQARTHLAAMREVRPLRRIRVWSRDPERVRNFAATESERWGRPVEPASSAREAVEGAGLICTATASREPVLAGEWIAEGAHVNAVGACTPATRELDTAAVIRSRLFVDSRESAANEAGDFLIPLREGAIGESHLLGELGGLVTGRLPGRTSDRDVTLFKSLGLAVEDLAVAHHLYRKATDRGQGTVLDLEGESR